MVKKKTKWKAGKGSGDLQNQGALRYFFPRELVRGKVGTHIRRTYPLKAELFGK